MSEVFDIAVDFAFYRDSYGGELGPEELSSALVAAARHVRWLVGGRAPACEKDALAYRRAVCAAADALAEWGEGQVGGFAIGSFSVTHYDNRMTTGAEMATEAAVKELAGTGLLFGGCAMRGLRQIPRRLLPDDMLVWADTPDGERGEARLVRHVRFERVQREAADAHRGADAGGGTVFVDAVNSQGAFEVPVGARVLIGAGPSMHMAECRRCCVFRGVVHHWELTVR